MKTFQALGALISYPTAALIEALPDLHAVIVEEGLVDAAAARGAQGADARARGDRPARSRGTDTWICSTAAAPPRCTCSSTCTAIRAIVARPWSTWAGVYAAAGFELAPRELPDYLPAMLEFLSQRPLDEARDMLGDCAHILRSIGCALRDRGSAHAAVFDALLAAVGEAGLGTAADPRLPTEEPDIDVLWAEEPAFGPATGNACLQRGRVRPRLLAASAT